MITILATVLLITSCYVLLKLVRVPVFVALFVAVALFTFVAIANFWLAVLLFFVAIGVIIKIGYSKQAIDYRKHLQN